MTDSPDASLPPATRDEATDAETGPGASTPEAAASTETLSPRVEPAEDLAIHTEDLTKTYGEKQAIDALNLRIPKGAIYGYIGPNGAGKTTTIRILAALLRPTSGSAHIHGVDVVRDPREIKRIVGYMPDSFGVYDNMTLGEYLEFFAAAYKIPRKQRFGVIRDVLELTDLSPKRDDFVSDFSKGMKQRACLAKTLLHDPQVLILDEPASGLDPRARVEFRELLRELQRMGKTILVSSHILTELSSICSAIGIIEAGKMIASGEVDTILGNIRSNRQFTLQLLDRSDDERAQGWVKSFPGVEEVSASGATVTIGIDAKDEDVARLVEGLVAEGIRFTQLREEQIDLETAFMTLTKGELA